MADPKEKVPPGYWRGWKLWGGGECPVPPDTLVEVRFRMMRNGLHVQSGPRRADTWQWQHRFGTGDVIYYRIREATK